MGSFPATFYDGKSARAHAVTVTVLPNALSISGAVEEVTWQRRDILLLRRSGSDYRLGHRHSEDAVLVVARAHEALLANLLPHHVSGQHERTRMARLLFFLIAGAAAVSAVLFIGVPAASGPLAQMTPKDFEQQMGENLVAQYTTVLRRCPANEAAVTAIQPKLDEMAVAGDVGFPVEINFIRMGMPNAFALPGGQVLVTRGLLEVLEDDPEAFLAVIAHELGHVKSRDGMQALYRNIGLSLLLEAITGGSGIAQQAILLGGQVTQMKHSRNQEARADEISADIMRAMNLNPAALARAFAALTGTDDNDEAETGDDEDILRIPGWLSSHPATDARIARANDQAGETTGNLFTEAEWDAIRFACSSARTDEEDGAGDASGDAP